MEEIRGDSSYCRTAGQEVLDLPLTIQSETDFTESQTRAQVTDMKGSGEAQSHVACNVVQHEMFCVGALIIWEEICLGGCLDLNQLGLM